MARKTLGTRQKLVFRVPATKPRNPVAVAAHQRKAGAHTKTHGAQRAGARSKPDTVDTADPPEDD